MNEGRARTSGPDKPLKLLVIGLNYAPDFIGIPKYTTEMCEELARRGHQVTVVTAPPYYPAWEVPAAYRGAWRSETLNGVRLVRAPIYVPKKPSGVTRLLHHLSFAATSLPAATFTALSQRPDVVLTVAPSLMSAPVALIAAKLSGAKSWLHIQDFEVDAAFELGMLRGERVRKLAQQLERCLLSGFDRVSTISASMRGLLLRKGVEDEAALEIRNWVDVDTVTVWPTSDTSYRQALQIPADHVVALYSGNMASKQGLETLAEVAALLEARSAKVTLLLCGQGPLKSVLEEACANRPNVRFMDLQPIEKLPELLATADVHLLPQRAEAADLVLPSKLTGMLASGRPVVAMADNGTGLATEVEGCGLIVTPGDAAAMTGAVLRLAEDAPLRHELGVAARDRAEQRWRRSAVIDGLEAQLKRIGAEI
ncbi:WcaI family glycosyltransferase [Caulobacter vibrioides]|uniref:WcaI family glycosyltransferase n=1 Tax=Caulobacter vibrioides TaxID=155892 RepID=UPI000BB4E848|nr:WcaI family glycosyltransferase [Caulobacter vibrioides]ATC23452.1 colanic acid biosynthesis glycosyltransferase WcaI [Caulobacter vibrioides]PLR11961.1 colanic acid biosynthesis glycosyltransferase WcaI [Caulobacter vibrioides]